MNTPTNPTYVDIEAARRRWAANGKTAKRAVIDIHEVNPDDPFGEPCWRIDDDGPMLSTRDLIGLAPDIPGQTRPNVPPIRIRPAAPPSNGAGRSLADVFGLQTNEPTSAAPSPSPAANITQLPISAIRRDGGTQPRAALDADTISDYTEAMQAGAHFPSIVVFYDGADYWLADGFHRLNAAINADLDKISVEVIAGTQRDAVLYSIGANTSHGLRRTNADKRRAVERLLRDETWSQWSDRVIAQRCAVANSFVSNLRRELTVHGEQSENTAAISAQRIGADGRSINTEHIGRAPAAPAEPEMAPIWQLEMAVRDWASHTFPDLAQRKVALDKLKENRTSDTTWHALTVTIHQPYRRGDLYQAINNVADQTNIRFAAEQQPLRPATEVEVSKLIAHMQETADIFSLDRAWLADYAADTGKRQGLLITPAQVDRELEDLLVEAQYAHSRPLAALVSRNLADIQSEVQSRPSITPAPKPVVEFPHTIGPVAIHCGDARGVLASVPTPVHLIITSPPYNTGGVIAYDGHGDDLDQDDYDNLLEDVWRRCAEVLAPGGRLCINVPFGMGRSPWTPVTPAIYRQLAAAGLTIEGQIVWDKGTSGNSTAWGSWGRPSNPVLRDTCEAIIIASKPGESAMARDILVAAPNGQLVSPWLREEGIFMQLTQDHWQIAPESAARVGHPAPFPVKLAENLVRLYGWPGCHVLDPFAGSGTTALAVVGLSGGDRCQVTLIDQSPVYCQLAAGRLAQRLAQPALKGIVS